MFIERLFKNNIKFPTRQPTKTPQAVSLPLGASLTEPVRLSKYYFHTDC